MAHVHEKIDFTVGVFVVYDGKVLMRFHDKYKFWAFVGGHIELDEDPTETAVRECKEETGLDVMLWEGNQLFKYDARSASGAGNSLEIIPPISLNRHFTSPTHEHINMIYFAKANTDEVKPGEGEQQDGWKWCSYDDLQSMDLRPDVKFFAELALEKVR